VSNTEQFVLHRSPDISFTSSCTTGKDSLVFFSSPSLPTLENIEALDQTIVLLFCLGLCSVGLALGGMSGVVLLLTLDRTVGSLLATRTALECSSILGLLCTAVTARIIGLLFVSHFEAWADARVSGSVGLLAGLGTVQSEKFVSEFNLSIVPTDVLLPLLTAYAALQLTTIIALSGTAVATYINR
jgi:hypothetical protein